MTSRHTRKWDTHASRTRNTSLKPGVKLVFAGLHTNATAAMIHVFTPNCSPALSEPG
jgi:hypothetical protein